MRNRALDLTGTVAMITGAAGGIGVAIAHELYEAGAALALVDLDIEALHLVGESFQDPDRVALFEADLSQDAQTAALPSRVEAELGSVDVLVNNAGLRRIAPFLEISPESWRQTLDVDLTAPFVLSQAVLPSMLAKGRGKIVNVASMAGLLAFQNRAAYCAAKAGLIMLTKTITYEHGADGIWCNAIAPGVVETPMTSEYFTTSEMKVAIEANAPMHRWAQPEEIAAPVGFLCGTQSDYINGTTLLVDGGWTAGKGY